MTKSVNRKFQMKHFLIVLLGFLSVAALYGGIGFIINPDGSLFSMNTDMLKKL